MTQSLNHLDVPPVFIKFIKIYFLIHTQIAVSTASWPVCSASSSRCATLCWTVPRAAPAHQTTRASAAAALPRNAATATSPATWTAASLTRAASLQTVSRSAWNAVGCAFRLETSVRGALPFTYSGSENQAENKLTDDLE